MATATCQLAVTLPNGREATIEEMRAYGHVLQKFIVEQEAGLPQVKDSVHHNQIIDYLRLLANSYNEQLRLFKFAETQRQRELLVTMLQITGNRELS
jgi:hypothetical protein